MEETVTNDAVGRVVAVLREAGRTEGTVRRYRAVLDRFAAFLTERGLDLANDQGCIEFIADQTGARPGPGLGRCENRLPTRRFRRFADR